MQSDITEVRGNDATEILINDHDTIKQLLSRLVEAGGKKERMHTLEQLKGLLTVHNATEENLVYPALSKVARHNAESMKLYNETAEADMLVFELDTMLKEGDDEKFQSKAEKLQNAVLEHIDDEEQKAFQHLRDKAAPEQQQMLTQSVREFRRKFHIHSDGARRAESGEV